jgi:selT/selW/selH-like putative selenoprotein
LAEEILKKYESEIQSLTLVPSDNGRYEVYLNNELIFSKMQNHRHARPGEIIGLIEKLLREGQS